MDQVEQERATRTAEGSGRLAGRVAIVTGSSRGLGRAIALAFAAEGAAVAIVGRTETVWDERLPGTIGDTVAEIEAAGGRAVGVRADLLERADIARVVEETRAAFGPVTLLVNNAAFTAPGRPPSNESAAPPRPSGTAAATRPANPQSKAAWPGFVSTPLSAFRRHFDITVFGAYDLMQRVAGDMIEAGRGGIVNITSGASRMPGEGPYTDRGNGVLPGYGGSKAALEHLTQCAAFDLEPHGIPVNALSPSAAIMTPGVNYYAAQFDQMASAEDFAEAAVRLALVDASTITGRVVGHDDVLDGSFRSWTA